MVLKALKYQKWQKSAQIAPNLLGAKIEKLKKSKKWHEKIAKKWDFSIIIRDYDRKFLEKLKSRDKITYICVEIGAILTEINVIPSNDAGKDVIGSF